MAHIYVDSNAAGAATGADWANAYLTLEAAVEAAGTAAADNIWIAHNHAESTAGAVTISSKNTAAAPGTVICVNSAGTVPPVSADLATTATVTTTGANSLILDAGSTYWYGITFSGGSGGVSNTVVLGDGTFANHFKNCKFVKPGTTANTAAIAWGSADASLGGMTTLDNCTVQFGSTGDRISARRGTVVWMNTLSAIAGATIPAALFDDGGSQGSHVITLRGVDLSAIAGGSILGTIASPGVIVIDQCKLHASTTVTAPTGLGSDLIILNSDSGTTYYRHEKYNYAGTQTVEIAIVRTGGASDGTTPISWQIDTTANSEYLFPFESLPIVVWNDTLSEITLTLQGIWGEGVVPTNAEIWMEVEYPGSALTPIASFANTGKADYLAAATNYAAGSGTWGGSTTKFAMSATFTPAMKGPLTVRVYAALASKTFYIDPKPVLS